MNPFIQPASSFGADPDTLARRIFHPFNRLPTELRLKVWHDMMQPRVVDVQISQHSGLVITVSTIPIVLHVNQESRREALKKYKKLFKDYIGVPVGIPRAQRRERIYFNCHLDTLYVPYPTSPFTNYREDQMWIPRAPYMIIPEASFNRPNSCKVNFLSFQSVYYWKITSLLQKGARPIQHVQSIAIDNPFKGSRHRRHVPVRIETYDLTTFLTELTEIVFFWGDSQRLPDALDPRYPLYTRRLCSEAKHNELDLAEIELTRRRFEILDRRLGRGVNQHTKVVLRYHKLICDRYSMTMDGESYNVTKRGLTWNWLRL